MQINASDDRLLTIDYYSWNIPAEIPKPIVPTDNPMSREKVELGRHLFNAFTVTAD
ncbi:MAG: hypothetical protein ACRC62_13955 [Microcoleus sp.]